MLESLFLKKLRACFQEQPFSSAPRVAASDSPTIVYSKVSWGVCSFICPSTCFILMQNCCTDSSLLSHDKTVSSLLELIDQLL